MQEETFDSILFFYSFYPLFVMKMFEKLWYILLNEQEKNQGNVEIKRPKTRLNVNIPFLC